MTKGEYRVGINFNPSQDDTVSQIKAVAAALIDLIEEIPPTLTESLDAHYGEVKRLKALAQTDVESAAMWAVKAATKPKPEA